MPEDYSKLPRKELKDLYYKLLEELACLPEYSLKCIKIDKELEEIDREIKLRIKRKFNFNLLSRRQLVLLREKASGKLIFFDQDPDGCFQDLFDAVEEELEERDNYRAPKRPNSQGINYDELAEKEPPQLYHTGSAKDTSPESENPDDFEGDAFARDEHDGYFFNCRRGDEIDEED